jgi:CheY-like chemotaxis protein
VARPERVSAPPTPQAPAPALAGGRILLAEDNVVNRKVAMAVLNNLGYRADAVTNGVEALALLRQEPFDLVLMDVQMPEMDGFEATARIRDPASGVLRPRVPVVAMTAHALSGDRERCLAAGMDDYVSKPIEAATLAAVIARQLSRRGPEAVAAQPQAAAQGRPAVFDRDALMLRLEGDAALCEELLGLFRREVPEQLQAIRDGIATRDLKQVAIQAHSIRGSSCNLGAMAICGAAEALEAAARAGHTDQVQEQFVLMETEIARFEQQMAVAPIPPA